MNDQTPQEIANQQAIEARAELARSINQGHTEAESIQVNALSGINALIDARVRVASLAESARAQMGATGYHNWWRESGLPDGWGKRYITLAKTASRMSLSDKHQMRLIGIVPDYDDSEDGGEQPTRSRPADNHFAWVKIAGKLRATLKPEMISVMDRYERETARNHLKPLVELYESLGNSE